MRRWLVAIALVVAACGDAKDGDGGGRSGFWTSRQPAKNGAYRWRLLGIGGAIAGVTGLVMIRLVRKANIHRRKARHDVPQAKLVAKVPEA